MLSRPAVPIPATVAGIESIAAASTSTTRPGAAPVLPFGIMAALGNAPLRTGLVSSGAIAAAGAFGSKKGSIPHPRGRC